jgi:hypothetical protein
VVDYIVNRLAWCQDVPNKYSLIYFWYWKETNLKGTRRPRHPFGGLR